ncbi:MAG: cysteine--tRNA ligase [Spirochaetaceae bacterium]|jgi:cysteinyl-tRNA synthetase|nr:cysteine--tRNA ligase [Spirochaetaceae bacterium]
MALALFNTIGRAVAPFISLVPGKVGFYGCGPTVYNYAHIGNLRAYVVHDILVRTLRRAGFSVTHVMNITDIGHLAGDNDTGTDKMISSARERGKSVLEVADFYTQAFFTDTERLGIMKPTIVCKATDHIADMIALIQRIEAAGYTYRSGGNLYFDIAQFQSYGELARLRLDDLRAGARITVDENKHNAADFVLWFTKSKFENQALTWDSPWGRGYPGWHIECSAMSIKYLGEQFDIHAGGIDHIPVHHTNEIAQSEAATGKSPWVRYWVHNEFLVLDKGKMSKSLDNFITLQTLVEAGYHPMDYRYFLMGAHYRSQIQFSYQALDAARNARKSLLAKLVLLKKLAEGSPTGSPSPEHLAAFDSAMEDDLSTPRALAALWALMHDQTLAASDVLATVAVMDEGLGLRLLADSEARVPVADDSAGIEALIAERTEAKKQKDFIKADRIRRKLNEQGIVLTDTPAGTRWHRGVL